MSEDNKKAQDRDGVGKTMIRELQDKLDEFGSAMFRTVENVDADGEKTRLRTKGGKPEVVRESPPKEVIECIKGPLTEIAFKYSASVDAAAGTGPSGYRRWYGEPDPKPPVVGEKTVVYDWSSDLLFCIEARKLQRISAKDGNGLFVDILFAEKPVNPDTPAESLPDVSPAAAGSKARIKFIEGKYPFREWYPPELSDMAWCFTGPTIDGDPTPEPSSAVKFFIKRLRSITFTASDTLKKLKSSKFKWIFATHTNYSSRTIGASTTACANKNAREVSFDNRSFFSPSTAGNMDKLTMSLGIDEPPANPGGPSFEVVLKKPGSFIAAVNPESAVGKTRPADKKRAIDMCDFAAFGNPYHGLYWKSGASAALLYKDSSRTSDWGFAPDTYLPAVTIDGGSALTHKYYNVRNKDPLIADNQVRTATESDGVMYPDALLVGGAWYVKDVDFAGWGQLQYNEFIYKDPAGTAWVLRYDVTSAARMYSTDAGTGVDHAIVTVTVKLMRRFGVLGTEFSGTVPAANTIDRTIATLTFIDEGAWVVGGGFVMYLFRQYSFVCSPDAKTVMCHARFMAENYSMYPIRSAAIFSMSGTGAVKEDAENEIEIGDGISVSVDKFAVPKHIDSGVLNVETIDIFYSGGRWNYLSCVIKNIDVGGGFYDRIAGIYRNGDEVHYVQTLATAIDPYTIVPVTPQPTKLTEPSSELDPPYWKPLGWAIIRIDDASSWNTKLVFRDAAITVDQADIQTYRHTDTYLYSAKIGWAYNYRTKELISVPIDTTAYFI